MVIAAFMFSTAIITTGATAMAVATTATKRIGIGSPVVGSGDLMIAAFATATTSAGTIPMTNAEFGFPIVRGTDTTEIMATTTEATAGTMITVEDMIAIAATIVMTGEMIETTEMTGAGAANRSASCQHAKGLAYGAHLPMFTHY